MKILSRGKFLHFMEEKKSLRPDVASPKKTPPPFKSNKQTFYCFWSDAISSSFTNLKMLSNWFEWLTSIGLYFTTQLTQTTMVYCLHRKNLLVFPSFPFFSPSSSLEFSNGKSNKPPIVFKTFAASIDFGTISNFFLRAIRPICLKIFSPLSLFCFWFYVRIDFARYFLRFRIFDIEVIFNLVRSKKKKFTIRGESISFPMQN